MDQFIAPVSTPTVPAARVRKDIANIYFLLDKSGSMWSMKQQAIDGFNKYIGDQRELEGLTRVTLLQFNSTREVSYSALDVMQVPPLTEQTFRPGGGTALNDTVGHVLSEHLATASPDETNIIAILTDGMENASTEYKLDSVKALLAEAEAKGWEILFLGANMTADTVVNTYGINASNVAAFDATAKGMSDAFTTLSASTTSYRSMKSMGNLEGKVNVSAVYEATAAQPAGTVNLEKLMDTNPELKKMAVGFGELLAKAAQTKP